MKLKTFSFFHLNLAYSAIRVDQRKEVIDRCYWPLLRLAKQRQLPFGIEASAWTLETIESIDPAWLAELRDLVTNGPCEFIGCGYAQIIGPLVPAEVNEANLRIGMQRYEELLGLRPDVALVNEQAYSAGLVPLYQDAGYKAIIMEWNNPARSHPDWDAEWRYLPQFACGTRNVQLPLIWNKSVSFQKVQRYVHGEMELDEYLAYVQAHVGVNDRAFPIYGNDVEVFDFRPGRYMTEAPLHAYGEWQRIDAMYAALLDSPNIEMIKPSEVLALKEMPGAGNRLQLETAAHPIPVKKQDKYNVLRWAVTGRGDLRINTTCWQIYEAMLRSGSATDTDWTELCYLWSSDFRTHITEARWAEYQARLSQCASRWTAPANAQAHTRPIDSSSIQVTRAGRFLDVKGRRFNLRLNCLRGLALESLIDLNVSDQPLCGTVHHGYYDDIQWAADYYTGHLVYESPGRAKVTDLSPVEPEIEQSHGVVSITASVKTPLGAVRKCWLIDELSGRVTLSYQLLWDNVGLGSLRLGHITLNPETFEPAGLAYKTHNGGREFERFPLSGSDFDHGSPVSFLISANQALGVTNGVIEIGDSNKGLGIQFLKNQAAAVALVSHRQIRNKFLCRVAFSIQELDDTCRGQAQGPFEFVLTIVGCQTA